ncbi:hypothetical protein A2U01_0036691, partial [Trifolium medium]|nr:hypothetical protein [Trifolium medium]
MAKAVMSTEMQDETAKTVVSTELENETAEAVMTTELQDEMAEAVMSTEAGLSIMPHETLLANLRSEADKAHTELVEAKGAIHK